MQMNAFDLAQICLIFLVFLFLMVKKKELRRGMWFSAWLLVLLISLAKSTYDSYRLWETYAADPVLKYLLPPDGTQVYQHTVRLFEPVLVAALSAAIIFFLLYSLRKKFQLEQYSQEDIRWLSLTAFVVSWPGLLLQLLAIFVFAVLWSIAVQAKKKKLDKEFRLVLTPVIAPVSVAVALFLPYLLNVTGLIKIRF